jgi:chromatin remodeling complex protein RSC6
MTDLDENTQPLVEPTTTAQKFELLLKDFSAYIDTGKTLTARMKVLQKEVTKATKPGRRRVVKSVSDDSDSDIPKRPSALQKPVKISDELCVFLGFELGEHSRQDVTRAINKYIKDSDIQDPANRRFIKLDDTEAGKKLKVLLRDPDQPVTFFNIQRYLKPHYPPKAEPATPRETPRETPLETPRETPRETPLETPLETPRLPPPITRQPSKHPDVVADAEVVTEEAPKAPTKRRVVRRTTG